MTSSPGSPSKPQFKPPRLKTGAGKLPVSGTPGPRIYHKMREGNAGIQDPDRCGDRPLLKGKDCEDETGDPRDPPDVGLTRSSIWNVSRIPLSANEAVKLAKKRKFQGLSGFVNGALRTVSREKEQLVLKDASIRYSIPQWMPCPCGRRCLEKRPRRRSRHRSWRNVRSRCGLNESIAPCGGDRRRTESPEYHGGSVRCIPWDRFDPRI